MRKINFTKMVASGNDFVIIKSPKFTIYNLQLVALAKKLCDRKYGIGADGLLFLGKSNVADIKMRVFNADGSEAEMCGNGARCAALWQTANRKPQTAKLKIETKAGIIDSYIKGNNVSIKLSDPKGIRLSMPININGRALRADFIDTGVAHVVVFVNGIKGIDVNKIGRSIRYHKKFAPKGTNVNFVEVQNKNLIRIRTYERGVEGETLACGTGSVAAALILAVNCQLPTASCVKVRTEGGEILKVYFDRIKTKFSNVWLEGCAKIVYKGECYV